MPTFPLLNSGSTVQYPVQRGIRQEIHTVQFLDGTEQRCLTTKPLHRWTLRYAAIDDTELLALQTFVLQQQATPSPFTFVDPATQVAYDNCHVLRDTLQSTYAGPGRNSVVLVIQEDAN